MTLKLGLMQIRSSCLTNLLQFVETVTDYVDQGYPVDVIFLDFQKVFDKVPHRRLLLKVKAMDIGSLVANWIESWLSDRKQRVVINGKYSGWFEVSSGVPRARSWGQYYL